MEAVRDIEKSSNEAEIPRVEGELRLVLLPRNDRSACEPANWEIERRD